MMRLVWLVPVLFGLCIGCRGGGSTTDLPVSGRVVLDGKPAGGVLLEFIPTGNTIGVGGHAVSGDDGIFEVLGRNGGRGLPAGEYRVTASRRRNPDGSPANLKLSPIESPAVETLDACFTDRDQTPLRAKVPSEAPQDFAVRLAGPARP